MSFASTDEFKDEGSEPSKRASASDCPLALRTIFCGWSALVLAD
jgi:hypothetical protein